MSRDPLFPSATDPRPIGTLRAVRRYWKELWPEQMSRALPGPRQHASREIFPHLPAARTETSRRLEGRREATTPTGAARPLVGASSFIDAAQTARAAVSPLGGVAK